jgi:hypothetical protein
MSVDDLLGRLLRNLLSETATSAEGTSTDPHARAKRLGSSAALRAAALSGGLSLPPGPLGLLSLAPDLLMIWRLQRQLVADTAAIYGRSAYFTRESLLYCLFRHGAAHAMRDLVVRAGERLLIRAASHHAIHAALAKVGVHVTERLAARTAARWVPLVGAVGVGAYAWYDTREVARTAQTLFSAPDLHLD